MERLQSIRGLWYINLHVGYWNFFSDLGTWLATFVPLARVRCSLPVGSRGC